MAKLNYQKICSDLLKGLSQRVSDVIEKRFGLKSGERQTLEAIGQNYGITRERVRQIENVGISEICAKEEILKPALKYINDALKSLGGLKKEDVLLFLLGSEKFKNQAFFLLSLDENLKRFPGSEDFYSFWMQDEESFKAAKEVINLTINKLRKENKTFGLDELFDAQKTEFSKVLKNKSAKEFFNSYIEVSKQIQANSEGKIGLRNWVEINPKGIKDRAYLVLKRIGKPLHFVKVASGIEKLPVAAKRIHLATVHNELIKDNRFVLVGRGLYALREWGYEPGFVKDVILKVLKEGKKPLAKEEIIKKVSEQRLVKENTILLNLQDKKYFLRDSEGKYQLNPKVYTA